ncbi:MAG: tRNA (N(6)-L-threonylcarbamoyladenosine(37)-C(2))-methylthiotransferase MtaB [Deltaproteobacteria bacterium]|nr:tRNA (N(6)-L-threonylcarbamoyladenosine(37)-C(2))-methylthiotransferase MtaB [Deltaproteobacteria bacterium]MBW2120658.1 tRNA (N(6)-L-threonylcarbamoyladenosine(37)-C(2))-methylthiotransferase MtaB [Deltaproteobacteria bacterium]
MATGRRMGQRERRTFAVATLGCKVNQFDSQVIREEMRRSGFEEVPFTEEADTYIVNTCTVTGRADCQSRQLIRRAGRLNSKALVIATGCYAEVFPLEASELPGVWAVLGNQAKGEIPSIVSRLEEGEKPLVRVPPLVNAPLEGFSVRGFSGHSRAFLKIQDGCNGSCSYCIVPRARGRSRSLPPEKALEELLRLRASGYWEVVLTGVRLGSYGLDLSPPTSLAEFLHRLEGVEGLPPRIRLSSIEPTDLSGPLVSAIRDSERVCPHLHIPLQSGDDEILSRMNRGYTRKDFMSLVVEIVRSIPSVCVGLDVIGGFPGEDARHFQNTVDLIESLPVAYLHVFPFSSRPGTVASELPQKVGSSEIRERCRILRDVGQKKRAAFYSRFLHQRVRILVEGTKTDGKGLQRGLSRNYIPVWIEPDRRNPSPAGELEVEITGVRGEKVRGERVAAGEPVD